MKRAWAMRKADEAVSPVIATILLVAITVVLVAVLYVMVLGMGGTEEPTPQAYYQAENLVNGKQVTIISITRTDLSWDDVLILVQQGRNTSSWSPMAIDLTKQGEIVSKNYPSDTLGNLTLNCSVYDIAGNGRVSGGDYIIISATGPTTFWDGSDYTLVLAYEPTGERIGVPVKLPRN